MKHSLTLLLMLPLLAWGQLVPKWDVPIATSDYTSLIDMKADASGNVYLLGQKTNATIDIVVIKYAQSGKQWVKTYDSGQEDMATALGLDNSGNVYVSGWYDENGSNRYAGLVLKYTASGTQTVATYNYNNNAYSEKFTDAYHDGTYFWVVGYQYNGAANGNDPVLVRYSSTLSATVATYNQSGEQAAFKITGAGTALYVGGLASTTGSAADLLYYQYSSSGFSSASAPAVVATSAVSWTKIDRISASGSNVAMAYDAGSSMKLSMYNGSSWKSVNDTSIEDFSDLLVDGSAVYLTGRSFRSLSYSLLFAKYSIASTTRTWLNYLQPTSGSTDHQTFSAEGVKIHKNASANYGVLGKLVLDANPDDGDPSLGTYAGEVVFDESGNQQSWSVYGASVEEVQFAISRSPEVYLLGTSTLWAMCTAPVVDLGGDVSVDYDPQTGSVLTLDAGAGHASYLWSTGATTQTIDVAESGTYSVTVANSSGCEASDAMTYTIRKINQTITWEQDFSALTYRDVIPLTAVSSSGLEVTYYSGNSIIGSVALNNETGEWELTMLRAGNVTIYAQQTGDEHYNAVSAPKSASAANLAYYWVGDGGSFADYATHWATTSGGTTFHTTAPNKYCDVYFDENSFTLANQTVSADAAVTHDFVVSNVFGQPVFSFSGNTDIYGAVDVASTATFNTYNLRLYDAASGEIAFHGATVSGNSLTLKQYANYTLTSDFISNFQYVNLDDYTTLKVASGVNFSVLKSMGLSRSSFENNGKTVFESSAILSGTDLTQFSGNEITFRRKTTFDNQTGRYSIVGSPVSGASTASLGSVVYTYDESALYLDNEGLNRFVPVSTPEIMPSGKGYFSAYTGTIEVSGLPTMGQVDVALDYHASSSDEALYDGYNLVANPYTAPVSVEKLFTTNGPDGSGAIEGTIYLWVDGGSHTGRRTNADYMTVNALGSVGGDLSRTADYKGYVGSFQGFFVKAKSASQTLTFLPSMISDFSGSNSDKSYFRTNAPAASGIYLTLFSPSQYTSTLIGMTEKATAGFDPLFDSKPFGKSDFSIASMLNDEPLVIQGLPEGYAQDIPLRLAVSESGNHELVITGANPYALHDLYTGQIVSGSDSLVYTFAAVPGVYRDRFVLSQTMQPLSAPQLLSGVYVFEKRLFFHPQAGQHMRYQLLDMQGNLLQTMDVSGAGEVSLEHLPDGVYLITDGSKTRKIILK